MRLAVVTHADAKVGEMSGLTHQFIAEYAAGCGAELVNIDHECVMPHAYRIMAFKEMLGTYDRILNLDSDILVMRDCPNIFDEVPEDCVGTVFEDVGSRRDNRRGRIISIQDKFGDVGWREGYINSGVLLVSSMHREMFSEIDGQLWMEYGYDDVHLGYQMRRLGLKVHELDYRWNHMTMFSEDWNGRADRGKSYIIHYAGSGLFDRRTKIDQIKADIERWRR